MTAGLTAAVLAGGPAHVGPRLREAVLQASLVIAADGGAALADALGLRPQLWVGDFDSATEAQLHRYRDVERVVRPRDKDELDLELAVTAARERGATELVLAGVFDGRLDQTLAAVLIGARLREEGVPVRLYGGTHEAHVLGAGDRLQLRLPEGTLFSLLSLRGDARVDVLGARFSPAGARLPFGLGLGVSNRAAGGPDVSVTAGTALLVIEWGERQEA